MRVFFNVAVEKKYYNRAFRRHLASCFLRRLSPFGGATRLRERQIQNGNVGTLLAHRAQGFVPINARNQAIAYQPTQLLIRSSALD